MDEGTPTCESTVLVFDTNVWMYHVDCKWRLAFSAVCSCSDAPLHSGIRRSLSTLQDADGRVTVFEPTCPNRLHRLSLHPKTSPSFTLCPKLLLIYCPSYLLEVPH
jgi:hypothetical protein